MAVAKKPYIILTGGDGGYGNLGDEWLLDAVKKRYKKFTNKFTIIILTANLPSRPSGDFSYMVDNLESFESSGISLNEIQAVHYYGGGYINRYWMKEKIWFYEYLSKNGFPKKKIFFTGVGLGPFDTNQIKEVRDIANSVQLFGKRDKCYQNEIGGQFMFDESVVLAPTRRRFAVRKNVIWVNFRISNYVGADENNLKPFLSSLRSFANENKLIIKYFSMVKGNNFDEKFEMERILRANEITDKVMDRPKNYKKLISQFSGAALVVTTSYHATLAALYNGLPTISLFETEYYKLKYDGLKEVFNTSLLHPTNIIGYNEDVFSKSLVSLDMEVFEKIKMLKAINQQIYRGYEEFLSE